jgi:hypothetical protein
VHGSRTHPRTGSCPSNRFEDGKAHRDPSTPWHCECGYLCIRARGSGGRTRINEPSDHAARSDAVDANYDRAHWVIQGSFTFACGPAVAAEPTPVAADPFVVVVVRIRTIALRSSECPARRSAHLHCQRRPLNRRQCQVPSSWRVHKYPCHRSERASCSSATRACKPSSTRRWTARS